MSDSTNHRLEQQPTTMNDKEHDTTVTAIRSGGPDPSLVNTDELASDLNVDLKTGLSDAEASRRLERFGPNELETAPEVPKWKKFLEQFRDPLVYLLLVATAISVVAWFVERASVQPGSEGSEKLPFDAIVIVLILIVNAVLGYLQEAKAEQAVAALSKMSAPQTAVLRDGQVRHIPTSQLVPGDILVLSEGDAVSADARLFSSASLRIAEASLTGESVPVAKNPGTLENAKALGDRTNMVFNGTAVTQGTGRALVTSTGMDTQVGKIADMLSRTDDDTTPLQKEMAKVSKVLGIAVCVIALMVIAALALMEGFHSVDDIISSLLLAVSLAVAAVPEGLTAILTVVLALGVQRMAEHHAIVKKLSSVETLGSASVICSDKTGTLTRNEMTVERVITASGEVSISGNGYAPEGSISLTSEAADLGAAHDGHGPTSLPEHIDQEVEAALGAGLMANDGGLHHDEKTGEWEAIGDPTEVSVIVAARKTGADTEYSRFRRVAEIPFTSERKRMSVIARDTQNDDLLTVFAKGAPDVLLGFCDCIQVGNTVRPLTQDDRDAVIGQVKELSTQAYRTLGTARRPLEVSELAKLPGVRTDAEGEPIEISEQSGIFESHLIWIGMVGIIDPPRTEVKPSIAQAHKAGIRTVMITGDHPLTASRIASDLGIIDPNVGEAAASAASEGEGSPYASASQDKLETWTMTGDELDALGDDRQALDKATAHTSVFARVSPEHKLKIVDSLQRQGNIVAMTGDGVNDAPAVKSADIGVAMGITGTEVTKESAKMILADDNFSTIVSAVNEGRGIFENIKKFLRYLLSSNMGEVFTVFGGVVLSGFLGITQPESTGVTVPLLATQLLWINLLTDAAPALAMGVDPSTEDLMDRPPRKTTDSVIDKAMWGDIIYIGVIMAAVTLIGMDLHLPGGLFTDRSLGGTHAYQMSQARTMGFTILVFAQMFNALASRSHLQSVFKGLFANAWLWAAIAVSVLLQVVVIYVPGLNVAFGTTPLSLEGWVECLGLSLFVLIASELRKIALRIMARR